MTNLKTTILGILDTCSIWSNQQCKTTCEIKTNLYLIIIIILIFNHTFTLNKIWKQNLAEASYNSNINQNMCATANSNYNWQQQVRWKLLLYFLYENFQIDTLKMQYFATVNWTISDTTHQSDNDTPVSKYCVVVY